MGDHGKHRGKKTKSKKQDLAYVAGLIDGEGCFSAGRLRGTQVQPKFSLCLTNLELLEWCKETFGGRISEHSASQKWGNKRHAWIWSMRGQAMCLFIEDILPYLKLKKEVAEVAWHLQTVRVWAGENRPGVRGWKAKNPAILKFYQDCFDTMRALNRRGVRLAEI